MQDHVVKAIEKDGFLYVITKGGDFLRMDLGLNAYWEHLVAVPLAVLPE